jgi:hypothetical protein
MGRACSTNGEKRNASSEHSNEPSGSVKCWEVLE